MTAPHPHWDTLLVANRGEIAVRILKSAKALGLRTVAVFSDADAGAPHVAQADVAVRIGPAPVAESYLDPTRILAAAAETGAEAIHPGYGFLSENADFAQAVLDAGLVWVGPPPAAIAAMGDKAASKARMREAGVPVVPGFDGTDPSDAELLAAAQEVGYPLLVKASAGGGGRGMRIVRQAGDLPDAIASARAEAGAAFGSGRLLLERLVEGARHVEVQVFADTWGTTLHFGERDCSVQRRNQKVVEEAPGPAVTPELRARMGQAACDAAAAVGYVGAGTVEFLLGADDAFYFLEMNTRLQVEHPVTEQVTGLDLVELQLRVALGEPLGLTQADVTLTGHSIEVRLYAEDPTKGYLPQPGPYARWVPPAGIRVDHGLAPEGTISAHYDPMVAKLIAHGADRNTARRRLLRALEAAVFFGGATNRALLERILAHPDFIDGDVHTRWLDAHPELTEATEPDPRTPALAVAVWLAGSRHAHGPLTGLRTAHALPQPVRLDVDGERVDARVTTTATGCTVQVGDTTTTVTLLPGDGPHRRARVGDQLVSYQVHESADHTWLHAFGSTHTLRPHDPSPQPEDPSATGSAVMPMDGTVLSIDVAVGDTVAEGDVLARVEAMKLETTLRAGVAGTVSHVLATAGQAASSGAVLVRIEPTEPVGETP